ncbi:toll/interleukin-1 receptor domain-containing protein [Empedobacter brevis]|uniref:toll/interleukin-1 receptor domain-containing protein n=1 Tax=Empedobacter brevis TaxID=247 RepID=UPI0016287F8C|nr:toll/interleukin-1 receptor domain-containing protein [Empedobacter brevis]
MKKIFISYSWKPLQNKINVQELAERLTNDGIHVILDEWDLKEGQDKYHFMEQMVNDETVDKVLLICNSEYAKKANAKQGGVGIESLIVSDEIYSQVEQTKFIPIVVEYSEVGKPYLPTFIKTKIYIDLSNQDVFEENYEKLLRNIYNKPLSKRPPIGKMPIHLEDENPIFLPTAHKVSLLKNSLLNSNKNSSLLIKDYLQSFIDSLLLFKLDGQKDDFNQNNFIENIELSIKQMQPLNTDFIEFLNTIFKYSNENFEEYFVDFFENLLQFYENNEIRLDSGNTINEVVNDNFRYFNYELFLIFVNISLKHEKFNLINKIFKTSFIVTRNYNKKAEAVNFIEFRHYNYTLNEFKNRNINPKRVSVVADFIKKYSSIIKFDDLILTDILCYYMSLIYPSNRTYGDFWFPELSCYNSYNTEIFPRIISKRYFEKVKSLFNVKDIQEYIILIKEKMERDNIQRGYFRIPRIEIGLNIENVGKFE